MKRLALSLLILVLTVAPLAACKERNAAQDAAVPPAAAGRVAVTGGTDKPRFFTVELAVTQDEQVRGLMDRQSMDTDHGMLFLFDTDEERSFWMKDTLIPLDIIFIDATGRIVKIQENAVPGDLTSIPSGAPVRAVLEINAGLSKTYGFKPGSVVHYAAFGNELAE